MTHDIEQQVAALRQLTARQLRDRYAELFGEPPRSGHKEHLVRRIAWRLQALREGDLSERARRRAAALARDGDLRLTAPPASARPQRKAAPTADHPARDRRLPMPGTLLVRRYQGKTLQVKVLQQGFEYEGDHFGSLTSLTEKITGRHWNGYHFFGLQQRDTPS
jgi:hypothetical protein